MTDFIIYAFAAVGVLAVARLIWEIIAEQREAKRDRERKP